MIRSLLIARFPGQDRSPALPALQAVRAELRFWGAELPGPGDADNAKCVACQRCVTFCPEGAITVERNLLAFKSQRLLDGK